MNDTGFDRDSVFFRRLPEDFALGDDAAQKRLLLEYGAVFVATGGVTPPDKVVFRDEDDVAEFQSRLDIDERDIGGYPMQLQSSAMTALINAISDANASGLSISPRGPDSARRNYTDTIELWRSRVEPALVHWVGNGKMTEGQAAAIRSLEPYDQVAEIFALEAEGIYFAKDLSKSIIYSVAPPGASQHLALLAFDVQEFDNPDVRKILSKHCWYQTVVSDLPHFTFLGVGEDRLADRGLKKVTDGVRDFWVPDL